MAKTAVHPTRRLKTTTLKPKSKFKPKSRSKANIALYSQAKPRTMTRDNMTFHTLVRPAAAETDRDLVSISSDQINDMLGKATARKIHGPATKLSRYLRRKGYALAMVPMTKEKPEALVGTVVEEAAQAPWDAQEAGRQAIEALKQAEGGAVDRKQAAEWLAIGLAQLYNRIRERKVVTWVDAAGRYQFPRWQFGVNGLLPGIQGCLEGLTGVDSWAIMRFFLAPSEAAGGTSPLALLRDGKTEDARKLAARQAVHG